MNKKNEKKKFSFSDQENFSKKECDEKVSQRSQEIKRECFLRVNKILAYHIPLSPVPFLTDVTSQNTHFFFEKL